jgi:hypothetical protein
MKIGFFLLALITISTCGCSRENSPAFSYEDSIVDGKNPFNQLVFVVRLKNSAGNYLLIDEIDSIKVSVNGKRWCNVPSQVLDTAQVPHSTTNQFFTTPFQVNYPIIAPYQPPTTLLLSAGDYVEFLMNRLVLLPGDYLCSLEEISFKDLTGNSHTMKPFLIQHFTVVENTTSSYVGEFEVNLSDSF